VAQFYFAATPHKRPGVPPRRLKNFLVEKGADGNPRLLQRPGLVEVAEYGSGPVHLIEHHLGDRYVLSGTTVYRNGSSIGTVASGGYQQAAQSETELVIVSGWNAYSIVSGVMTQITDPDLGQVSGVQFLGGYFVYPQRDSSEYVFSEFETASVISALSFANAEKNPDPITRVVTHGDNLWFFGTRTIEPQYATGNATQPFVRSSGQGYDKGCPSPYSVVPMDNALIFVAQEQENGPGVYRGEAVPKKISDHSVDQKLRACTDLEGCRGYAVSIDGHAVYCLDIPGQGTVGIDLATGAWSDWETHGETGFRLSCGDAGVFGDRATGQLWEFDPDVFADDGEPITREASIWLPTTSATVDSAVCLVGAYGVGLATGQGSDPRVEMRYSSGGLGDFCPWQSASLGVQGDREARARWFQQGMITAPGRLLEFRCTDPVRFTPYYVLIGAEAYG
jgi:hypothetical protein